MLTRSDIPKLLTAGLKTEFSKLMTDLKQYIKTSQLKFLRTRLQRFTRGYDLHQHQKVERWKTIRKDFAKNGFTLSTKTMKQRLKFTETHLMTTNTDKSRSEQQLGSEAKKDMIFCIYGWSWCFFSLLRRSKLFDTDHLEGDSGVQSNYSASECLFERDKRENYYRDYGFI